MKKDAAPGDVKQDLIPGSDGAGIVVAVGSSVSNFKAGDRVVTHMCPFLPDDQVPTMADISAGLGHSIDGTLRTRGNFHESALVRAPKNLHSSRACTLTCSGLTAWNALFGLKGRAVQSSDWVLVQGTGGVSIAALQFAVAAGATVVATTSSAEKAARLKGLGAAHVLNYRQVPAWGTTVRALTPGGRGVDFVVDVGGNDTLLESLNAIRTDGIVVATGLLGGTDTPPIPMLAALMHACTVRGILLGTRNQFEDMVRFVEEHQIEPVIDHISFDMTEVKDAYERLEKQQHFSKVVVKM